MWTTEQMWLVGAGIALILVLLYCYLRYRKHQRLVHLLDRCADAAEGDETKFFDLLGVNKIVIIKKDEPEDEEEGSSYWGWRRRGWWNRPWRRRWWWTRPCFYGRAGCPVSYYPYVW